MEGTTRLKQAVREYKKGKPEAFTTLYNESSKYVYTCIYKVMSGNDNAQDSINDIMQDTYVEISKYISQLDDEDKFLSWAGTIATRKCYAYLKKNNRYVLLNEDDNTFENLSDDDNIIPEEVMQDKEKQRLVRQIIENELTEMQKLCIVAFYYNEQKRSEIAKELGIPENTVKTNLTRAKAKIKESVLDLEKNQGTRLYSVAPFLLLLFKEDVQAAVVPKGIYQGIMSATVATSAGVGVSTTSVTTATKGMLAKIAAASVKTKIIAGLVTVSVIGGTAGAVHGLTQKEETYDVVVEEESISEETMEQTEEVEEVIISEEEIDTTSNIEESSIEAVEIEPIFVPWSEAGLEDYEIIMSDERLYNTLRREAKIVENGPVMLSEIWEMTELVITFPLTNDDLRVISVLTNLTHLEINGEHINDISSLGNLTNLTYLKINKGQISDISVLENFTNLEKLTIWHTLISDISVLENLTNLEYLNLYDNQVSDISSLRGLVKLEELNLENNLINDVSAISTLINLEILHLSFNQISDISSLSNLLKLNRLRLDSNQISDISALANLTELSALFLNSNEITDIGDLKNLIKLEYLHLMRNQISDISSLENLINMKVLLLSSNQISDISALEKLTQTEVLGVERNMITDASVLANLTNVEDFRLEGNQISDISEFENLTNAEKIHLKNNPVSEADIELLKEKLPECTIYH